MAFFTKQDFSSSIFPHPLLSMIVFHSLQSRFLITSAIAYRLLVYPNLNARLKNLKMRSRYLPWYAAPQISIPYKNRDIIKRSNNFVSCSLGYPKYLQMCKMYKRLLALHNKLSTWRSQSNGFSWKIMPTNFNQLFHSIPWTSSGSGSEILPCTTISQVLVRLSFIWFLTAQRWMPLISMKEWSWCADTSISTCTLHLPGEGCTSSNCTEVTCAWEGAEVWRFWTSCAYSVHVCTPVFL